MQNMHYFPNAAIYPKRKSRMMDGILREALGKYGIYPAEVEQSVAAGQPKECRAVIELDAEALSEKEEELCKAVLPPIEHRQLERTRRPQQRKRRQIKVSGFITSDDWLAIWEEYEAARTKPAGKRGKRASQAPRARKSPSRPPRPISAQMGQTQRAVTLTVMTLRSKGLGGHFRPPGHSRLTKP